ncbi:MAG: HIT domain-containing protein [Patescibacteria group bacterium]|nr:HIT domain-containing protein [Patescibacteria group bacterium]
MESNCIFCKIIAGQIPCAKVYEDDQVLAFLDINPVSKGHVLIVPKSHHSMMVDTPDQLVGEVFIKAKTLMKTIKRALEADFVMVSVVGIEVPHFHVHLIPRYYNDGLANGYPTQKYGEGEMDQYVSKIISQLEL